MSLTTKFCVIKCFSERAMKYNGIYWLVIEYFLFHPLNLTLFFFLDGEVSALYFRIFAFCIEMEKMQKTRKRVKCLGLKSACSMGSIWCSIKYWMHNECNQNRVVDQSMMSICLLSRIKVTVLNNEHEWYLEQRIGPLIDCCCIIFTSLWTLVQANHLWNWFHSWSFQYNYRGRVAYIRDIEAT